jgi:putative transposase
VGKDRIERNWRYERLKVPQNEKPRGRLWLNDGSCLRLRPVRFNHIWSYDFIDTFAHDGRTMRMLNLIDEFTLDMKSLRYDPKVSPKHWRAE